MAVEVGDDVTDGSRVGDSLGRLSTVSVGLAAAAVGVCGVGSASDGLKLQPANRLTSNRASNRYEICFIYRTPCQEEILGGVRAGQQVVP
jgi:hypothetical protein